MLNINESIKNGKALFTLSGGLDASTAPELERTLKDALPGVSELTLNLKDLEYISSAGLRVLLSVQKIMNKHGKMKVTEVNATVKEIFDVTGFTDILTIE